MQEASEDTYRERLRERLLAAAESVVAREGVGALQARRIAQDAACSVGTLYNIFGDLDGLILQVNARTLSEMGRLLTAAARRSAAGDLETRLNTLAITYLDFATVHRLRWRAVFEHQPPERAELPESFAADRRRLLALIEDQLGRAIQEPAARSNAAHALFGAVHGIVWLSLDGKLAPFEPADCERQIRFLVGRIVSGMSGGLP